MGLIGCGGRVCGGASLSAWLVAQQLGRWREGTAARANRRIALLLPATADDAQFQTWVGAFLQGLAVLGWTMGRNVRIDTHWATPNAAEIRKLAAELAALAPDVILARGADDKTEAPRR
jgi:hypothetical protein